jgi:DNA-binding MarR family transcriptional regulator
MIQKTPEQVSGLQSLAHNLQTILRCFAFGTTVKSRPVLTITQMRVLSYFNDRDVIHVSDISRRLDMSIQSVNNIISRLEATGYVQRSPNQHDRRLTDIRLTGAGRASIDSFEQVHMQHMHALLQGLSPHERRRLCAVFEEAAGILDKAEQKYSKATKEDLHATA